MRKRSKKQSKQSAATVGPAGPAATLFPSDALDFALAFMRPLLGDDVVVPGRKVRLSEEFLCSLEERLPTEPRRPAARVESGSLLDREHCVLMLDHSVLPDLSSQGGAGGHARAEAGAKNGVPLHLASTGAGYAAVAGAGEASAGATGKATAGDEEGPALSRGLSLCIEIKPKSGGGGGGAGDRATKRAAAGASAEAEGGAAAPLLPPACRFCMHQVVKAVEGKKGSSWQEAAAAWKSGTLASSAVLEGWASQLSHYCPCDFFSGCLQRCQRAIYAAACSPQNNFRLFLEGEPAFSSEILLADKSRGKGDERKESSKGETSSSSNSSIEALEEFLAGHEHLPARATADTMASKRDSKSSSDSTPRASFLCAVAAAAFCNSGLLPRLKAAQQLDAAAGGSEGAWDAFKAIATEVEMAAAVGSVLEDGDAAVESYAAKAHLVEQWLCQQLHPGAASPTSPSSPTAETATAAATSSATALALQQYMLAATAKDCSLMLAFKVRPLESAEQAVLFLQQHEMERKTAASSAAAKEGGAVGDAHPSRHRGAAVLVRTQDEAGTPSYSIFDATAHTDAAAGSAAGDSKAASSPSPPPAPVLSFFSISFSVAVVDLDPKPLNRIPRYWQLERDLQSCYEQLGYALLDAAGKKCGSAPLAREESE